MGRRTAHTGLNRNNDFYNKYGQLKEGYSFTGGNNMVARGTGDVSVRYGAGKDGTNYKIEQRTIYGKESQPKAAPQKAPAPAPKSKPKPKPKPEPEPIKHSPEIQQAKASVAKYKSEILNDQTSKSMYGNDQDLLSAYTQDFDARNSTEGEKSTPNLNLDLPNNVDTTDNNYFANGTFDPVNKSDEAAQNFLSNKKNLVLNNFR